MSWNSFTVRPVNDLKSNGFLDNLSYESKERTVNGKLMVMNLFRGTYARDLMSNFLVWVSKDCINLCFLNLYVGLICRSIICFGTQISAFSNSPSQIQIVF